jgi:putative acetyltransferase
LKAGPDAVGYSIRRALGSEHMDLLVLWERAVRSTHLFLDEDDINALRPLVAEDLASHCIDWWVLVLASCKPIGFLGLTNATIEALFVDPDYHRRGAGAALVDHAQSLHSGALWVDVNEQNPGALRFYQALGFVAERRSSVDSGGRPFPILHLHRPPLT